MGNRNCPASATRNSSSIMFGASRKAWSTSTWWAIHDGTSSSSPIITDMPSADGLKMWRPSRRSVALPTSATTYSAYA
jgi:hypothetical protein